LDLGHILHENLKQWKENSHGTLGLFPWPNHVVPAKASAQVCEAALALPPTLAPPGRAGKQPPVISLPMQQKSPQIALAIQGLDRYSLQLNVKVIVPAYQSSGSLGMKNAIVE
jgi:hypothetical protein